MPTFVDQLQEALTPPWCLCAAPEDDLWVDASTLRGLLIAGLRQPQTPPLAGAAAQIGCLVSWVRDGGLDEYLQGLADTLIEMGVAREQEVLDRFLRVAVKEQIGPSLGLPALGGMTRLDTTDRLLLDLATRPPSPAGDPPDVRVAARRYARALSLLNAPDRGAPRGCTELGAVVRQLPPELVLPFLITLEGLTNTGVADASRAPREAYQRLFMMGEAEAPEPGRPLRELGVNDGGDGPWRWARLQRWVRMGICEPCAESGPPAAGAAPALRVRLTNAGRRALYEALRTPAADVVRLCIQLHRRARETLLATLRPRRSASVLTARSQTDLVVVDHHLPVGVPAQRPPTARLHVAGGGTARPGSAWDDAPAGPQATASISPVKPISKIDDVLSPDQLQVAVHATQGAPRGPVRRPVSGEGPGPFDVEGLCRAALRDLRVNPRFHHIAAMLSVRAEARPLLMTGDRRALRRLMAELLATAANAVSGQPLPRLLLEVTATESDLSLLLHDNGPGIPVSQRPRVFADRPGEGPLPRYLLGGVRRVIEGTLQGRIEIAAPRLGGASFRLTLPRDRQRQAA